MHHLGVSGSSCFSRLETSCWLGLWSQLKVHRGKFCFQTGLFVNGHAQFLDGPGTIDFRSSLRSTTGHSSPSVPCHVGPWRISYQMGSWMASEEGTNMQARLLRTEATNPFKTWSQKWWNVSFLFPEASPYTKPTLGGRGVHRTWMAGPRVTVVILNRHLKWNRTLCRLPP